MGTHSHMEDKEQVLNQPTASIDQRGYLVKRLFDADQEMMGIPALFYLAVLILDIIDYYLIIIGINLRLQSMIYLFESKPIIT